jgi:hypothetical protein
MADDPFLFNPIWRWDPPVWQFVSQVGDPAQAKAVVEVQLQLTKELLTAQLNAVESLQRTLAP